MPENVYIWNMKTLVIVDVQWDFYHPQGKLYVKGGEFIPERILAIAPDYDNIICTLDWHPANHCSFAAQGGPWPPHCVIYTMGAGLPNSFSKLLADGAITVCKAYDEDVEQYGAFEMIDNDDPAFVILDKSDEIDVCGIAGDYCVKETIENMLKFTPSDKISLIENCIVSIDDGTTLKKFIEENNLRIK